MSIQKFQTSLESSQPQEPLFQALRVLSSSGDSAKLLRSGEANVTPARWNEWYG